MGAALRVSAKYASRLGGYPSKMGAAPRIWTFLSSLSKRSFSPAC
jgi:hypothetical protein